jgi:23S rRNA pseudouridine2605 synthase
VVNLIIRNKAATKLSRKIGLARAISKLGYCSRSRATEFIHAGRVTLNGRTVRNPETPVLEEEDEIAVDGSPIGREEKIYLMLNKPRGVVTSASDERGRKTVYALLNGEFSETNNPASSPWVAPVGRLDKASEGLLLLTNDSEWGARIAAPETHLPKTYHMQIATLADDGLLDALTRGVRTGNSEVLRGKQVARLRAGQKNCWLEIVLDEGKNRQIRRMMEAMNVEVLRLVRVAIGPLLLGNLAKGAYRALTAEEKLTLDRAMRRTAS